jgi:predicted regulator of Ras-like GTPase activity (Roadblock/LC7/MglB family)
MAKWNIKDLFWRTDEVDDVDEAVLSSVDSAKGTGSHAPTSQPDPRSGVVHLARGPLDDVLASLRDVQGVVGSLAVGTDGVMWARDLPAIFDEDSTQRLAARLVQLYEALGSDGSALESGTLRYQAYHFHLGVVSSGVVGVLAEEHVNLPALRMALRLVGRRLATAAGMVQSA